MEYIQAGSHQIRKESLEGITLKDAKERYHFIDERLVKMAWEKANPKRKSKKNSGGK